MTISHYGFRLCAVAVVTAISVFHAFQGPASAASMAVELACASDFYTYCSKHDPDSEGARRCMDANGNNLSKRCVNALVRAGEVSKSEVDRRAARSK